MRPTVTKPHHATCKVHSLNGCIVDILSFEMSYYTFKTDWYIIFNKSYNIRLKTSKLRFYYRTLRKTSVLSFEILEILENKYKDRN